MKKKLVLFGAEAFAEIAHYFFTHDSPYEVVAFTVDRQFLDRDSFHDLPVVPFDEVERKFPPGNHDLFVAMGLRNMNQTRAEKFVQAQGKGYHLPSFISSKAVAPANLVIGDNSMVMEMAGVHPYVEIGDNSIIWSSTRIGYRTRIGDHCWLSCPLLGESVVVGDYTFIGLDATVAPFAKVGRRNLIGARAFIRGDTQDDQVFRQRGTPPSKAPSSRIRSLQ